ncbi:unnamed protein product [Triticum turgidum subsp. durum]|uniref:Uncharacterized protein n=1 Tax=Triticum turgidum subsp. durum TaxID=4567 RepID=A0A9R0ZHJ2_TRITD|nr:unnamed protein product [Triticum turgidum subsp. durum]
MIRLLQTIDNGWYITEHRGKHNRVMARSCGEMAHWPSHEHIDGTLASRCHTQCFPQNNHLRTEDSFPV